MVAVHPPGPDHRYTPPAIGSSQVSTNVSPSHSGSLAEMEVSKLQFVVAVETESTTLNVMVPDCPL